MKLVLALSAAALLAAGCTSSTAGAGAGSANATTAPASRAAASTPPATPSAAVLPSSAAGTSGGAATTTTVLRPVTASGVAAPGWTVRSQNSPIFCSPAEPSPVAVDPGIAYCSPSAAFAIACWRTDAGFALCLVDPDKHVLVRYPLTGSFASPSAPRTPAPITMSLGNGASCTIRDGGTGVNLTDHPDWVQYYFCTGHTAVYGPPNGTGVQSTSEPWTVDVAPDDGEGTVTSVAVAGARFVGTAAG